MAAALDLAAATAAAKLGEESRPGLAKSAPRRLDHRTIGKSILREHAHRWQMSERD